MKVAFGLKAHSGWAVLVVLGINSGKFEIIDRRRIELVSEAWAKQPYHAAETLEAKEARQTVARGISAAHKHAGLEMRAAIRRAQVHGYEIQACAVLMGKPMPQWSVDQILAVHFRMHQAEGVLFREALAKAAVDCGLRLVAVPEMHLNELAVEALSTPATTLDKEIKILGKSLGPPWGKDQKDATLAAIVALGS